MPTRKHLQSVTNLLQELATVDLRQAITSQDAKVLGNGESERTASISLISQLQNFNSAPGQR